jgi:hypothetical protein
MIKFLVMYPPPLSCYLVRLKPKYLSQHPVLRHPHPMFLYQYVLSNFPPKFLIPSPLKTYDNTAVIMTRLITWTTVGLGDSISMVGQNVLLFTVSSSTLGSSQSPI